MWIRPLFFYSLTWAGKNSDPAPSLVSPWRGHCIIYAQCHLLLFDQRLESILEHSHMEEALFQIIEEPILKHPKV